VTVVDVVRRRGYRTLLVGQGVSALGDWMGTFALLAVVWKQSGSSSAVGGILALRLLPAALGGPLAAKAAGKWDRRKTMVSMDLLRAGMIAVVPLVRGYWWIYVWAFMIEVGSIVFLPARDSSIPDLVDEEDLPIANGLVLGSSYGTIPIGAALFAAVAALPGADLFGRPYALVFWIDGLSYVVSAVMIMRLTQLGRSAASAPVAEQPDVRFRDALKLPLVQAVLPATIAVAVGLGALFSLGVRFVRDVLNASDAQFGVLIALFGVGAAIGLVLLQRQRDVDEIKATRAGVAALGIIVAAFSLAPALGFAFLGAIAFGAAAAFTLASGMGALQQHSNGRERVLAFTAFHVVVRSGLAVAAVAAGAAGDLVNKVHWPIVGTLEGTRLVLLCSGLLVLLSSTRVSLRGAER
jgi:predicted MFS family arabinose efflux permease